MTHICGRSLHIYVYFERSVSPGDQICWSIYVGFRPYMLVHICGFIYVGFRPYMLHIYVDFRRYMLYPPLAYMCIMLHICAPIYVVFRPYMLQIYALKMHIYVLKNAHICARFQHISTRLRYRSVTYIVRNAHICASRATYMWPLVSFPPTDVEQEEQIKQIRQE